MKQEECERRNFNGCVEVCRKVGESFSNCAQACSIAVKNLCSRKTSLSIGNRNFNTKLETEHRYIGWILLFIFLIVVGIVIWKIFF